MMLASDVLIVYTFIMLWGCNIACSSVKNLEVFIRMWRNVMISLLMYQGGLGSVPGQSVWDLWWAKWHWNRFLLTYPSHYHSTNAPYSYFIHQLSVLYNLHSWQYCELKHFSVSPLYIMQNTDCVALFENHRTGRSHFTWFLCDFTLMWLKNLHHFLNLCDKFRFNAIWHRWSLAALVLC
jgi:hypothetical protein